MKNVSIIFIAILTLVSCGKLEKVEVREVPSGSQELTVPMPQKGQIRDLDHGKEVFFAIGALSGVEGYAANGVSQSQQFEDGTYRHTARLNIITAADGYFYEGWLVKKGEKPLFTGHLRNHFGDERHFLQFESDQDLREYTSVVITLEPDDGDPAPAAHVAEGLLKVRER